MSARRRALLSATVHLSGSLTAGVIVAIVYVGSRSDAASVIAALALTPLLLPTHPRPRRQAKATPEQPDIPYELGWWL